MSVSGLWWEAGGICLFSFLPQFLRPAVQRVHAAALRQRYVFIIEWLRILAQKTASFYMLSPWFKEGVGYLCCAYAYFVRALARSLQIWDWYLWNYCVWNERWRGGKENRSMKIVLLRFEFCACRNSFPLIIRILHDVRSRVPQWGGVWNFTCCFIRTVVLCAL